MAESGQDRDTPCDIRLLSRDTGRPILVVSEHNRQEVTEMPSLTQSYAVLNRSLRATAAIIALFFVIAVAVPRSDHPPPSGEPAPSICTCSTVG